MPYRWQPLDRKTKRAILLIVASDVAILIAVAILVPRFLLKTFIVLVVADVIAVGFLMGS